MSGVFSYADGWTWFDANGSPVTGLTHDEKALAFIEGRYAKASRGMMMGGKPDGQRGGKAGGAPGDLHGDVGDTGENMFGKGIRNGGPAMGSTASAASAKDSANYASFDEMTAEYASDIAEITAGDEYGKNIVSLYTSICDCFHKRLGHDPI